jgi:hypothetical protein
MPKLAVFDLEHRQIMPLSIDLRITQGGSMPMGRSRWMPDGSAIVFVTQDANGRDVLVRRPLDDWRAGSSRSDTLFAASSDLIESFGISPDGRKLVASVLEYLSGLSIVDGIKGVVPPKSPGVAAR